MARPVYRAISQSRGGPTGRPKPQVSRPRVDPGKGMPEREGPQRFCNSPALSLVESRGRNEVIRGGPAMSAP